MTGVDSVRPRTPRIILVAIGLLVFAVAAPFIGSFIQDLSPDGQNVMLGDFFVWTLAGLAAGMSGIVCAFVGAWRGPSVPLTYVAMVLAVLLIIAIAMMLALMFSPSS